MPYLMSSHPGTTLEDAVKMAIWMKKEGCASEQVQDFYPTPGTISTVMYATGIHPLTGKSVYVCKNPHEKQMQRALLQPNNPKNADLVREALTLTGHTDLIGYDKNCIIRPAAERESKREVPQIKLHGVKNASRPSRPAFPPHDTAKRKAKHLSLKKRTQK